MIIASQSITPLFADPRLVYGVAVSAIVLLVATIWLFRRSKRDGRGAGFICLFLSVALHGILIFLVPYQAEDQGGSSTLGEQEAGVDSIAVSMFDPSMEVADAAGQESDESVPIAPLPISDIDELMADSMPSVDESQESPLDEPEEFSDDLPELPEPILQSIPEALVDNTASQPIAFEDEVIDELDQALDELLVAQAETIDQEFQESLVSEPPEQTMLDSIAETALPAEPVFSQAAAVPAAARWPAQWPEQPRAPAAPAFVPGSDAADFANRIGSAKQIALLETGGSLKTEAAVKAALRFLAEHQRRDGAWDPATSGAGVERRPLGESRLGAGTRCETGITGLALLAMMGAGNTHLEGEYDDCVYQGLSYLIGNQAADGSMGGSATLYAKTYCHSMASLSLCEAAVLTQDQSALEASKRAIEYTKSLQHPITGGWRYTRGDRGDLSQLGWQAMVLDAGKRAGIPIPDKHFQGVERFLRGVRVGRGGLACYRNGEATSRTMTAEALATRLLMGESIPDVEINEAEQYLLRTLPGSRQDNYYYWYYATLALHQLQDDAWLQWNEALKQRLLSTQRPDGSWPASTVWGGYGGTVYTTAMATLCLESYYRHAIRRR